MEIHSFSFLIFSWQAVALATKNHGKPTKDQGKMEKNMEILFCFVFFVIFSWPAVAIGGCIGVSICSDLWGRPSPERKRLHRSRFPTGKALRAPGGPKKGRIGNPSFNSKTYEKLGKPRKPKEKL